MYHGFNETIEDFIINKCSSSLEILENGKWIFQEGEISDINITGYIKDHLSHSENNVIVKLRDRSVPVKVPAEKKLVIDVSISGAGDFEKVEIITTGGRELLDVHTLHMNREDRSLYCTGSNESEKIKFLKGPMIKILDRLMEGNNGRFYLKLCGQIIPIEGLN